MEQCQHPKWSDVYEISLSRSDSGCYTRETRHYRVIRCLECNYIFLINRKCSGNLPVTGCSHKWSDIQYYTSSTSLGHGNSYNIKRAIQTCEKCGMVRNIIEQEDE